MILFAGVPPIKYATYWACKIGEDKPPRKHGDGVMFFEFGSPRQKWTVEFLTQFADAIKRTLQGVEEGYHKKGLRSFHLYVRKLASFARLNEFTHGYFDGALSNELDPSGEMFCDNYSHVEIHVKSFQAMIADCKRFHAENAETLKAAYKVAREHCGESYLIPPISIGHDVWMIRNGYRSGFSCPGLSKELNEALTQAAKKLGQCHLYLGRNDLLHLKGDSSA